MSSPRPFGPQDFVPFSREAPLEYLIHTGTPAEPHVALNELSIPGYNFNVAERLEINIGALGGFAVNNGYKVLYVTDNPNDAPTKLYTHYPGRIYRLGDKLFEPTLTDDVLAIYFNGLTASRVISAQKETKYSLDMWISHLSLHLRLALDKSIRSRKRSQIRRLAQTIFLRERNSIGSLLDNDDALTRLLGEAIKESEAE